MEPRRTSASTIGVRVSTAELNKSDPRTKRRSLEADTLAASVVILLVVTVVQRTIGFGRGVLFCRWLTPEALGEWEMASSFITLAAPLAVLGVPGSFGRYAEHYRQRGHLRTFLHRAAAWTAACSVGAVIVVEVWAPELSRLVFGSTESAGVMRTVGVCLVAIILHNTLISLLTALRLYRIVSAMNFSQSLLFAVLSLAMMWRRPEMLSILYGYSLACLFAGGGALAWAWPALRKAEAGPEPLPHSRFWSKLLRFAFFVWATNLLTQVFVMVDRYMLVHYSGMAPAEALDQIGHYHASRIIPLLMVSVAELLTGLVMPHLSHDWEAGRQREMTARLNLAIKLTAIGMLAFGACVIAAGPVLFNIVLAGKYPLGLAVLPWTVAGCVWYSVYLIAQNYLWCAEKNWLQTPPLLLGLAANVLLNLLLLPVYGLHGCVVAAACGAFVCLAAVLAFNRRHGMATDRGVWLAALAPAALGLGPWAAMIACGGIVFACLRSELILVQAERTQLKSFALELLERIMPFLRRRRAAAGS
jgi:O-antigen/teichoic acid export membrane protein